MTNALKVLDQMESELAAERAALPAVTEREPAEVAALLRSADLIRDLAAQADSLKAQTESHARTAELVTAENERLRRELKRAKGERDHYLKAFTALKAQQAAIAAAVLEAVKFAEVHAYAPSYRDALAPAMPLAEPLPKCVRARSQ